MTPSSLFTIVENAATEEEAILMVKERLQDYNEKLRFPPYFDSEISAEDFARVLSWQNSPSIEPDEVPFLFANVNYDNLQRIKRFYGGQTRIQGGKYVHYTTRNPNGKLSNYGLCNRREFLLPSISQGKSVNILRKEDADFAQSQQIALKDAQTTYDKYESLTKGLDPGPTFTELYRKYYNAENQSSGLERVRYEYNNSEWVKAIQNYFEFGFKKPHEYFHIGTGGRQAFIDKAMNSHLTAHNILDDSNKWFEKVQPAFFPEYKTMGDFEWHRLFWDKIAEASPKAWLIVFDIKI